MCKDVRTQHSIELISQVRLVGAVDVIGALRPGTSRCGNRGVVTRNRHAVHLDRCPGEPQATGEAQVGINPRVEGILDKLLEDGLRECADDRCCRCQGIEQQVYGTRQFFAHNGDIGF